MSESTYPTFNTDISVTSKKALYDRFINHHAQKAKDNPLYVNPYVDSHGYYTLDTHLIVTTIFATVQGEMPYAGRPAIFLRLAGCNRGSKVDKGCEFCFPINRKIFTVNRGKVSMGELVPGDTLLTFDENFSITETKVVENHRRDVFQKDLMQIKIKKHGKIERHHIVVTKEHPFNIKGKGWVDAKDLKPGMIIHHAGRQDIQSYLKKVYNPMFDVTSRKNMMLNKTYAKSKLEQDAHDFFKRVMPGIKYVGDNSIAIGDETHGFICPDFIIESSNKVIEVYDPSFKGYAEPRKTKKQREKYENKRRKHFHRFGYDVEFFTPVDFDTYDRYGSGYKKEFSMIKYNKLVKKARSFITNGIEIVEVKQISETAYQTNRKTSKGNKENSLAVANVTCAPYNHFLIDGMHVHNCDTFFTIHESSLMTYNEVAENIHDLIKGTKIDLVVISGGEPMLQIDSIYTLIKYIHSQEWGMNIKFQFETNGDFHNNPKVVDYINRLFSEGHHMYDRLHFVCSPKSRSGNFNIETLYKLPYYESVTRNYSRFNIYRYLSYRYLIATEDLFNGAYSDIPKVFKDMRMQNVYLSPITVYKYKPKSNEITKIEDDLNLEATRKNVSLAIELATKYGLKVSFQAHSYIGIA